MAEVKVAEQDTFGTRKVGPESTVRIQIKKGDRIPPDVELEDSSKSSSSRGSSKDGDK